MFVHGLDQSLKIPFECVIKVFNFASVFAQCLCWVTCLGLYFKNEFGPFPNDTQYLVAALVLIKTICSCLYESIKTIANIYK